MAEQVVLFVIFTAKEGKADDMLSALTTLTKASREEEGCITYAVHRDNKNKDVFILHEVWESAAAFEGHQKQPHLEEAQKKFADLQESMVVHIASAVSI